MLMARIKQKPCARLDDRPHSESIETLPHRGNRVLESVRIRIQQPLIDRQPDAAISDLRQQLNRRGRIVVCAAVCVVREVQEIRDVGLGVWEAGTHRGATANVRQFQL